MGSAQGHEAARVRARDGGWAIGMMIGAGGGCAASECGGAGFTVEAHDAASPEDWPKEWPEECDTDVVEGRPDGWAEGILISMRPIRFQP